MPSVDLGELFRRRRSIRKYRKDPVDRESLNRILEAGRWAPSGANRQPWLFVVVDDADAKAEIRRNAEAADTRWHERAPEWMRAFFDEQEITTNKSFLTDVPYLICVFGERGNPYWRESAWLAIGQMLLAATAEGLGTLTYTPGQTSYLNKILKVDARRYMPLVILPVGVADEDPPASLRPRKPLEDVARFTSEWSKGEGDADEPLHELDGVYGKLGGSFVPALGDSRLTLNTFVAIARILQEGSSAADVMPRLARELTLLIPAKEVEISMMGSALRCELPTSKVKDGRAGRIPEAPAIEGGKAEVPLVVAGHPFGALILERKEDYTPLELEMLIEIARVISIGLWSRFMQAPGR